MYNSSNNKESQPAERSWKTKVGATVSALAAIAALTVLTASAEKPASKTVRADIDKSAVIAGPVYDKGGNLANGDPPLPGDTPLWGNNYGSCSQFRPITWDGRRITLAEWTRPQGTASMKCVEKGTHVVIHLSGLIPKAVYTIWVVTFGPPGFTPDFSTFIGLGALGLPDGSQNAFVASATGQAELSVIHPPGDLSVVGTTGCLLDEAEVQLWVVLHMDGQTHGPVPGNECSSEEPAAFRFTH